jgi:hypothetical protein
MRIKNSINANSFAKNYEKNYGPSLTIPDQTMSIREIVDRYAKGLPIDGARTPIWDEENDLPNWRTLDLAERQELAQQYEQELQHIKQNHYNKDNKQDEDKDNKQDEDKDNKQDEDKTM